MVEHKHMSWEAIDDATLIIEFKKMLGWNLHQSSVKNIG